MKTIENKRRVWVCPRRNECDNHTFESGKPCNHDFHHEPNVECVASECRMLKDTQCRWEEEDANSPE